MVATNTKERELVAFADGLDFKKTEEGLTGAQITAAYKAALADFVRGRTSRGAIAQISSLLAGALAARKQQLAERDNSSSHRISNFY